MLGVPVPVNLNLAFTFKVDEGEYLCVCVWLYKENDRETHPPFLYPLGWLVLPSNKTFHSWGHQKGIFEIRPSALVVHCEYIMQQAQVP